MNASLPSRPTSIEPRGLASTPELPTLDNQLNEVGGSARTIIHATLTACAITIVFLLLYRFYMTVFLLFTASALQVAFQPVVEAVHQRGLRRAVGVFLVYALLLLFVLLLTWFIAPLLIDQARTVLNDLPTYYQKLRSMLTSVRSGLVRGIAFTLPEQLSLSSLASLASQLSASNAASTVSATTGTAADTTQTQSWLAIQQTSRTLFAIFAVFALAYYWTLERDVILLKLILQAPSDQRDELRALINEIQLKIGAYFRGQLILCVIVGAMSTGAFLLIGVPNALVLGILMGIFEAIPVLGPTLGAIPAVLMTLATAPQHAIWVVIALVAVQGIENNFLVPRIMDRSVGVSAVVSLLALAAFGALFGIVGAILAIPLAAILQILANRLLFNTPWVEDAPNPVADPLSVSRGKIGLLRTQAQELAFDIRKQARAEGNNEEPETEVDQIEDEIEMIAVDLDRMLAQIEEQKSTATPAAATAKQASGTTFVPVRPSERQPIRKGSNLP